MTDLILYTTEDGRSQIKLRAQEQTVWLTQLEMAELFDATKQNISLHLKNVFEDGELSENSVVKESLTTAADGKRYRTLLYNLDAILAVGYRVRSPRGVQFRRWASTVLKEYLLKGFVMDDERLKNPDGRPDYFDEMLERIRDIRASEKRFYQKVRDLFALSSDYDIHRIRKRCFLMNSSPWWTRTSIAVSGAKPAGSCHVQHRQGWHPDKSISAGTHK